MQGNKLPMIAAMVGGAVLLIVVLWIIAIIGAMNLTDGCLYRYNFNEDGSYSTASQVTNTVILKANGNYTALSSEEAVSDVITLDPTQYGQWLNTNLHVSKSQKVKLTIKGEVSLCKAYLPINNLQTLSNTNIEGDLIPIPRTEDKMTPPASVYFDAKTDQWRNIAQLFRDDHVVVSIVPDQKSTIPATVVYNSIENSNISADCREGMQSYSPICGRYSIWDSSSSYTDSCQWREECYECNCREECGSWNWLGICFGGYETVCDWCGCYENVSSIAPEPYQFDGKYTSPWYDDISSLITDFNQDCSTNQLYIDGYKTPKDPSLPISDDNFIQTGGEYQDQKYFWFSADNAAGLLYRFDNNVNPTNANSRGSNYNFARIQDDQSFHQNGENYKIIMNTKYNQSDVGYLQYRFHDNDGEFANNTGGYVLNIKQTKCRRTNGNALNDVVSGRGRVQYIVADYGSNPNLNNISNPGNSGNSGNVNNIIVDANGSGEIDIPSDIDGYLWIRIKNDPNDYKDSFGQYNVEFSTSLETGEFFKGVLDPFFTGLKDKIKNASISLFKNMTCYKGIGDTNQCTNFFQYIKFMLIIYVIFYGMMFLLGMVKINQTDLVIRVIKIGIVAGLMNDKTFEFFNNNVFDFVTVFSDDIMSNISGYGISLSDNSVSNPFMFLDEVMTKIFFSSTFAAQMMALLSMGLNGVLYFILMFVCICIVIIVALRAIAVYLMAFMAIAVLIGLAPLFLTFILFERTWYLFDNWIKFMIRYMLEPIILLAGIIILMQLFTIYLDYIVGYSVCWKCAIPIKIPFPQIEGVTPAFLDVELFCINWFAPWGFDHRSSAMGLNMQSMIVLIIIAYCMWGYVDFSANIVARLAGGHGGPSATRMGNLMYNATEQNLLSKVGLDANSRRNILGNARMRSKSMRRGDKQNPPTIQQRKDKSGGDGAKSPKTSGVDVNNISNTNQLKNKGQKTSSWANVKPKTDSSIREKKVTTKRNKSTGTKHLDLKKKPE